MQRVSALRRALAELLLAHGAQVLSGQVLEGLSHVGQPVQMFSPQQPLLDVPRVPLYGVYENKSTAGTEAGGRWWRPSRIESR